MRIDFNATATCISIIINFYCIESMLIDSYIWLMANKIVVTNS